MDPGSVWQQRAWKKFNVEFSGYMQEVAYVMSKQTREEIEAVKVPAVVVSSVATIEAAGVRRLLRNEGSDDGELVN